MTRSASNVVRPLSYSRPHQAGTITPTAASRASRGSASSKPSIIGVGHPGAPPTKRVDVNAEAGRAQTLQDARKPMHTDPSTIWVFPHQRTTQEHIIEAVLNHASRRDANISKVTPEAARGTRHQCSLKYSYGVRRLQP